MGLFSFTKKTESVALIDIGSGSVGGAYAHFTDTARPVIYYSVRVPVERALGEGTNDAMLRALGQVEESLTTIGAPALRRATGSGHVDRILVSVGAPWQETKIVTKRIQKEQPFIVTRLMLRHATERMAGEDEGRIESGRAIIATMLNGYEIGKPFGKKASRMEVILLLSTIEKEVGDAIIASLRRAFHAHDIQLTAFAPASYTVFRDLYPHQKDFIILDVTGTATDAAFVKHGLLASVESVPHGLDELIRATRDAARESISIGEQIADANRNGVFETRSSKAEQEWLLKLRDVFAGFAASQALPRTLFLLARDDARDFLKRLLETGDFKSLWLTGEPLSVLPVSPHNLSSRLDVRADGASDFILGLLALFYAKDRRLESLVVEDERKGSGKEAAAS